MLTTEGKDPMDDLCEYHPGTMLADGECPKCAAIFDGSRAGSEPDET